MEDVDRPEEDATADEVAEWMEEDFGEAVADGMEDTGDGNASRTNKEEET